MKKLIRKGVWETNSSSSHSIALATEDKEFILDTIYPDQHGRVFLNGGEYGWEWFKHNDALEKANYAAQALGWNETLINVIKDQTGAKEVIINTENGYIDHESYGIVPKNYYDLKNFIFNKNSWLFGGNDNSEADPTFYHVPEYKQGLMIVPNYKFVLKIEGFEKITNFLEEPTPKEIQQGIDSLLGGVVLHKHGDFINTDGNIYFQIMRNREDFFEMSYWIEQDYSKGYVIFVKEDFNYFDYEKELISMGILKENTPYQKKTEIIKNELLKQPHLYRKVNFKVEPIT